MAYLLALDIGSTLGKACLWDARGRLLARSSVRLDMLDTEIFWRKFKGLVEGLLRKVPSSKASRRLHDKSGVLVELGISVQRSSFMVVDRGSGKTLSNIISWQDTSASHLIDAQRKHWGRIQSITGLRPNGHYGASKMRNAECRMRNKRKIFLPLGAWLVYRLGQEESRTRTETRTRTKNTSRFLVDPTLAQRTMLMDIRTLNWSKELCRMFKIPLASLPTIQPSVSDFGGFVYKGRTVRIKVLIGDQQAAFLGLPVGPLTRWPVLLSLGTGGFVLRRVKVKGKVKMKALRSVLCSSNAGVEYIDEGTINHVGSLFERWGAMTGWDFRRLLQRPAPEGFDEIFIPAGFSLGSPTWETEYEGKVQFSVVSWQLSARARVSEVRQVMAWAMANGVAELVRRNLQALKISRGSKILLCGGWAQSRGLVAAIERRCQVKTRVLKNAELGLEGLRYLLTKELSVIDCRLAAGRRGR